MRYMSNLRAKKPLTTGGPWSHPLNSGIKADYSPDTVPQSNEIFDRGGNICVPPVLTGEQKDRFVKAFLEDVE